LEDKAGFRRAALLYGGTTGSRQLIRRIFPLHRERCAHPRLAELYGTEVSPDLISRVTDAVLDEVREWQNRPLEAVYPVVFFDALRVKIRDEGLVKNKAIYVALALDADGEDRADRGRQVLAQGNEQSEESRRHRHPDRPR